MLVARLGVRRAAAVVALGVLVLVGALKHHQDEQRRLERARANAYVSGMGALITGQLIRANAQAATQQ
jgi:hypothetical protein